MAAPVIDLVGKRFGRLVVIRRSGSTRTKPTRSIWLCKCDCGKEVDVNRVYLVEDTKNPNRIRRSKRSCGCLSKDNSRALGRAYGSRRTFSDEEAIRKQLFNENKNTARRRGITFSLKYDDFVAIISDKCWYCWSLPKPKRRSSTYTSVSILANGIDRVDSGLGYTNENSVPCCFICNRAKADMEFSEWMEYLDKVSIKHYTWRAGLRVTQKR